MSVTIKGLIDRVARDLIDVRHVRWSRPELIDFLNDAIAAIVLRRPDLTRKTVTINVDSFTVGLPVDLYKVLAVNHINLMAAQYVDINKLNQLYPNWRTMTGEPTCWTRNELDEKTLFLFPAPESTATVEIVYSSAMKVDAESDDFPITEIYEGVVSDYVMYRAYNKDSMNPSDAQRAQLHLQAFATALGEKSSSDQFIVQMIKQSEVAR